MQPLNAEELEHLNAIHRETLSGFLDMEFVAVSAEQLIMRMPVTDKVKQPFGIVHGGATVALCETVASIGTYLGIDRDRFYTVGLEINCNHIRQTRTGHLTATARPVHRGRATWVWEIHVRNDDGQLAAISRCTMAVVSKS
jgi:1,4-dihydroxy-2-naphthoyl-CoA hydrolase